MATSFPTSLDAYVDPDGGGTLAAGTPSGEAHHLMHANAYDAIAALEAKVGVNGSAVTSSLDYKVANLVAGEGFSEILAGPSFNTFNRKLTPTTAAVAAGTGLFLITVVAPISITAAKIKIYITVAGSAAPTVGQLSLFSLNSAGDGTQIAATTTGQAFTATGLQSFNLVTPVALAAGTRYAIGFMQSNGTGPTLLASHNNANAGNLAIINPAWSFALRAASTTTTPASFLFGSLTAALGYPAFYAEISA